MRVRFLKIRITLWWRRIVRKLGFFDEDQVYYIGGSETLPPPLSQEEEKYLISKFDDADMDV